MTKAKMIETLCEFEKKLWDECIEADEKYGASSEICKTKLDRWCAIMEVLELVDIR